MQFKRILVILLAFVMLVGLLPAAVFAEDFEEPVIEEVDLPAEELPETPDETKPNPQEDVDTLVEIPEDVYSGTCGDHLRWLLSGVTLGIYGNGEMADYYGSSNAPWYNHRSSISRVYIQEGVLSIGAFAFYLCDSITRVSIPDTVLSIANSAFWGCDSLTSVSIPDSVSSIDAFAFYNCSSLNTIFFEGNAPTFGNSFVFSDVTATVYYPANDSTWTAEKRKNYGGDLTWVAYNPDGMAFTNVECTNNQSIVAEFSTLAEGISTESNFTVRNPGTGTSAVISSVSLTSDCSIRINFDSPLKAGTYELQFSNGSTSASTTFEITLDLSVYKIVDDRHVIIQLSDAIIGCNVAGNYSFHTLDGDWMTITEAVSAFTELGGVAPNVFKLTTARPLQAGTTYVVETKAMFKDNRPCQGTIAYFTPEGFESQSDIPVEIVALTNNQSIKIRLPYAVYGAEIASNYVIKNSARQLMTVGNVQLLGNNVYEINFADPLKADHYTISTRNLSNALTGEFDITLDLRVVRVEDKSVIIQLNEPIYGCTDAPNYFVHKLGMSQEITAVKAESVFAELGGELPNVFRITLPERIVVGQTYIIETRAMALDPKWEHPCQGTIAYFTK